MSTPATPATVAGLQFRMPSKELAAHLRARADYHDKRKKEKEAVLPQVKDAAEKVKAHSPAAVVNQFAKSSGGNYSFQGDDAVESLEKDIETHHNKAVAFRWLAEHLFEQDYCLTLDNLMFMEVLKRY